MYPIKNLFRQLLFATAVALTTLLSHAQHTEGTPQYYEHMALMNLVSDSDVTDTAVQDGDWSEAQTWGGDLPAEGARILIPEGLSVRVDDVFDDSYQTIRVDGELDFANQRDTQLVVDTMVVSISGKLTMGTENQPIDDSVTARIIINNIGEFETENTNSPDYDPLKVGLGVIVHGSWIAYGMERDPSATFTAARAGDISIQLDRLPSNWLVGDEIVIANCRRDAEGDEVRTIAAVDYENAIVTLDRALSEDHLTPNHTRDGLILRMHIINLTRNIIVETAPGNEEVQVGAEYIYRGHTMMMHSNKADIRYVQFREMGRTNKLVSKDELLSAEFDDNGAVVSVAYNPIARYPVHFHRAGTAEDLAIVEGCSVIGSPGWAYVNHSSAVKINRNVSYDIDGASFISEAGNEIGEFYDNVSIRTHGTGTHNNGGTDLFKIFGNAGDGFWIHSQFVRLDRNVATGFTGHGIAHWQTDEDLVDFKTASLPSKFAQEPELETSEMAGLFHASTRMKDNTFYGGQTGVFATFSQSSGPANYMTNLLVFGVEEGVNQKYFHNMVMYDSVFIGDIDDPRGQAFQTHNKGSGWKFFDCHFEGFERGVSNTGRGNMDALVGGYLNNINNIYSRKFHSNYYLRLVKDVTFARNLSPRALAGRKQSDFKGIAAMGHAGKDYTDAVANHMYYLADGNIYRGFLAYEQTPEARPFINGTGNMPTPESEMGKTNEELEPYNYGAEYVPASAFEIPSVTHDNWIHDQEDKLPADFDGFQVYVVEPIENIAVTLEETQSEIDLSKVFFEPLGATPNADLHYKVEVSGDSKILSTQLVGTKLTLSYAGSASGEAIVKVTAYCGSRDADVSDAFKVRRYASYPADVPRALADSYTIDQDLALVVSSAQGVLANDKQFGRSAVRAEVIESTNFGSLALAADGGFVYQPKRTFSGTDWFTYLAIGSEGRSNIVKVVITVNDTVNDAPIAVDDTSGYYEAIETLTFEIADATDGLLANDYDPEGEDFWVSSYDSRSVEGGIVRVNADGTFSYTPDGDFAGADSFTYTITDGTSTSQPARVNINVKKVFSSQRAFFTENWSSRSLSAQNWIAGSFLNYTYEPSEAAEEGDFNNHAIQINRGTQDASKDSLDVKVDTSNYHTISVEYARKLTDVLPNGRVLYTYWSDNGGSSWSLLEQATETVTTLSSGSSLVDGQLYVITNAGAGVDYSSIGGPTAGNAFAGSQFVPLDNSVVPAGGNLNESPSPDDEDGHMDWELVKFDLPASADRNSRFMLRFYFKSDSNGPKCRLDNIKVLGVPIENTAPQSTDDSYEMDEDTILSVTDPYLGLLANDYDGEYDFRIATVITPPSHGQLSLKADGTFSYKPDNHFYGVDRFVYQGSDLRLTSPPATVTITVHPVEDLPVGVDDNATVVQGDSVVIDVLANDEDDDGDALTIVSVSPAQQGQVSLDRNTMTIVYTAGKRFQGKDIFSYILSDENGNEVEATVLVQVEGSADAPVANSQSLSTLEDGGPIVINLSASSPTGRSFEYSIVDQPLTGSVRLSGNVVTYTPVPGYIGVDTFTFRVDDGIYYSNIATVAVDLLDGNEAPEANDDFGFTVTAGVKTAIAVLSNDVDPDGDELRIVNVTNGEKGMVSVEGNILYYTAELGVSGIDHFTYTVSDGVYEDSASVEVMVYAARDDVLAHYAFDADYADVSGNGRHGSLAGSGGGLSDDGRFGAGSFKSTGSAYISVGTFQFSTSDDWSIAMWIKSDERDTSKSYELAYQRNKVNNSFEYNYHRGGDRNYYLRASHYSDEVTWWSTTAPRALDTDVWHHIAISCDGSSNKLTFYEDGVAYDDWDSADDTAMVINALALFNGAVDEVWITSSALSTEEIRSLMDYNILPSNGNTAPIADAGRDQVVIDTDGISGERITLDGSASRDSDGSIVSYRWLLGSELIASGEQVELIVADGVYTFTLQVTDDAGGIASDTVTVSVSAAIDSDNDGMPDSYEKMYNLDEDADDSELDSDGDGVSNYDEFITGTNPRDPSSRFLVEITGEASGVSIPLKWTSADGRSYAVMVSSNMVDWTAAETNITATSPENSYDLKLTEPAESYFIKVEASLP